MIGDGESWSGRGGKRWRERRHSGGVGELRWRPSQVGGQGGDAGGVRGFVGGHLGGVTSALVGVCDTARPWQRYICTSTGRHA